MHREWNMNRHQLRHHKAEEILKTCSSVKMTDTRVTPLKTGQTAPLSSILDDGREKQRQASQCLHTMPQALSCLAQGSGQQSNPRLTQTPAPSHRVTSASLPGCGLHPGLSPAHTSSRCWQSFCRPNLDRTPVQTSTKQVLAKILQALPRPNTCTTSIKQVLAKILQALSRPDTCTNINQTGVGKDFAGPI